MELRDEIEIKILDWYDSKWNFPTPFSKKRPLSPETSLSTGKYPWARETGDDIMKDYFSRFDIDNSSFDLLKYWPVSKGSIPDFIRPRSLCVDEKSAEPLTIAMLIESAKAGRWLY